MLFLKSVGVLWRLFSKLCSSQWPCAKYSMFQISLICFSRTNLLVQHCCREDDLLHTHAGGVTVCFICCCRVTNTPRAECLQEESEAVQKSFVGVSLQCLQTGILVFVLMLLCTEKVQALPFNGWLLLDGFANGFSCVTHETHLHDFWKTPLTLH